MSIELLAIFTPASETQPLLVFISSLLLTTPYPPTHLCRRFSRTVFRHWKEALQLSQPPLVSLPNSWPSQQLQVRGTISSPRKCNANAYQYILLIISNSTYLYGGVSNVSQVYPPCLIADVDTQFI